MELIFPKGEEPKKQQKQCSYRNYQREQEVEDGREKKPTRPFSVIYADAKQALTRQVGNTMAAYGLPIFYGRGILSGILAEIRTNAGNELADDTARYEEELKEYYEAQIKEKRRLLKEKAELIRTFEEPAVLEETEEPEMTGTEGGSI